MKKSYLILISAIAIYFVVGATADSIIHENYLEAMEAPVDSTSSDDTDFRNKLHQKSIEEKENLNNFYPSHDMLGSTLSTLISLVCFGMLGSVIRLLLSNLGSKSLIENSNIYTVTVLGGIVGLLSIVLSHLLPEFKYESGLEKVQYSFALLAGIYTKEFFKWLEKKFNKILDSSDENNSKQDHESD